MSWFGLAGALALIATTAASAQQSGPQQGDQRKVEIAPSAFEVLQLQIERYRRMTVPVTIMGEGPFRFIIDTGAQATVLSHDLADRLQLNERETAMLVGMNSSRSVETAVIPEVTLGSRSFPIQAAPLVEGAHIGAADGILGLDSLQNQRVLLDFQKGEISVADAENLQRRTGYDIIVRARRKLGQLIITRARLDGVRTAVIVDTGAQGSIGNAALLRRLRRARESGSTQMTDINGVELSGSIRIARSLEIGQARLSNLAIIFSDSPTFHALGLEDEPALLLGMSELRLFNRVAIDFRRREVLFDLPPDTHWPSLARSGG